MQHILSKIPSYFWICLGIGFVPIGLGIGIALSRSSGVSVQSDTLKTSIAISTAKKIEESQNNTEYANEKLAQEIAQIKETLEFFINNDTTPDPILQTVKKDIEQLEPTIKEIERNNEKLKEVVEEDLID